MLKKLLVISILVILLAGCSVDSNEQSIQISEDKNKLIYDFCEAEHNSSKRERKCRNYLKKLIQIGTDVNESNIVQLYRSR